VRAYLNYIVFNEDYTQAVDDNGNPMIGAYPLDVNAIQDPNSNVKAPHYEVTAPNGDPVTIRQDGYMFIYLSNESDYETMVFFDDFKVTHTKLVPDEAYDPNQIAYRYGFNGKEKDQSGEFGLTSYDYGFRIYNPAIAKFLSVDPLTKDYPELTPYQFASNTPIAAIDLDGLEGVQFNEVTVKDGQVIKTQKVVQMDVWVGVSKQQNSVHYKSADVPTIEKNLNTEFAGQVDANGKSIEFRFNMKTFNADLITEKEFNMGLLHRPNNYAKDENGNINYGMPKGIVLVQMHMPPTVVNGVSSTTQGGSVGAINQLVVSINDIASDPSHTQAHEVLHRFMIHAPTPFNPSTASEHNNQRKAGGLFTYGVQDPNTGNIKGTRNMSKNNLKWLLQFVPKAPSKVIDETEYDEAYFKSQY